LDLQGNTDLARITLLCKLALVWGRLKMTQDTIPIWSKLWKGTDIEREMDSVRYDGHLEVINELLEPLSNHVAILEAGCSLGRWVVYISSLGFNTIGLDIDVHSLKRAKSYVLNPKCKAA